MDTTEYVCPSCGVMVSSEVGLGEDRVTGEPLCVICAPYDPEREQFAILFLDDAQEEMLKRQGDGLGTASQAEEGRPPNIIIRKDDADEAMALNDFLAELFEGLYGEAPAGSTDRMVLDHSLSELKDVNALIKAKLVEGKVSQLIMSKEDSDQYFQVLELLHTRYINAHRVYIDAATGLEEARQQSYHFFWHLGSLVRSARLAAKESPWVTGEKPPRF